MLFRQLHQDFVFLLQPGLQEGDALFAGFDLLLGSSRRAEARRFIFEELLDPAVRQAGMEMVFLTKVLELTLVDQVPAQDRDIFLGGEILTFVVHQSSPLSLS